MSSIVPSTITYLLAEHRNAVADGKQAVEVVCDHVDGQSQRIAQLGDQLVEFGSADRVEARCRLVEKHQCPDRAPARAPVPRA
jgi:hypothetical protein